MFEVDCVPTWSLTVLIVDPCAPAQVIEDSLAPLWCCTNRFQEDGTGVSDLSARVKAETVGTMLAGTETAIVVLKVL